MISVVILTKNEEHDISGCLQSVSFCDDVHVYDSYSTDRTVEVARGMGAHVHQRPFDSYAAQRNAALDTIAFKHRWVFILDCDERLNPVVWAEAVEATTGAPDEVHAFRIRRDDHFLGHHLRHAQMMALYTRLVKVGHVRYTRDINEFLVVDGETRQLRNRFDHWSFSKGLDRWFDKHNLYSTMEAKIVAERSFMSDADLRTALFHKDFHTRRRAQKAIFYMLPGRPLLRWVYLMFARGGVLDGKAGVVYATLQAMYEWQIVLKTRELLASGQLAAERTGDLLRGDLAPGARA
jgi:glycosyltransferase involved in cell wall biosynthesis